MRKVIIFILLMQSCLAIYAQSGTDFGRAGLIIDRRSKMEKTLKAQNARYTVLDFEYYMLAEKLERNTDFLREFDNYLNNFHDAISTVAEAYGIYYELNQTKMHMKEFLEVLGDCPENTLAVALSGSDSKNKIYTRLYTCAASIGADIITVMRDHAKMTEFEKMQIFGKIRPKLREFNKLLKRLTITVKYTSFAEVLHLVKFRYAHYDKDRRAKIINKCRDRWETSALNGSGLHR